MRPATCSNAMSTPPDEPPARMPSLPDQTTTTNHTIQIRHPHAFVSQAGAKKLRTPGRPMSGDQPFPRLTTKNHTAVSIDRDDPRAQAVIANVFGATSERATRAGGHEEIINPPVKLGR